MKPANLDQLLDHLPGLRRLRSLDAALLRVLLDRQPRECTWCGTKVGRSRQAWCGQACVDAFKSRCCANTVRRLVEKRDGGVCRSCGRDTVAAEREAKERRLSRWASGRPGESREALEARRAADLLAMKQLGYGRGVWREVDHHLPVTEYGGLCDISQLRLLCGACHAAATKELAKRRKVPAALPADQPSL